MGLGKTYSTKYLVDSNNNTGAVGEVLVSTATGINWANGSDIVGGPYLPLAGGTMTGTAGIIFPDNFKLNLGAGSDLQIYHDGSNSYINDAGTGSLLIRGNNVVIGKYTGETLINAFADGRVDLYYDNSVKLSTTSAGVEVTGKITNLTAGTGNLDAVNVQQLNDATTGALIFQGTWSAASTTTGVHAAGSTSTIIVLEDPNLGVSLGSTVTGTGIPAGTTVTTYYNSEAFGLSAAITMVNGAVATFTTVGGIPDLSRADQKVTGNYYICETAGVATPNGASTTPDDWAVGDWVAFSDLATDAWQKIDNSSVLSGAGTGGTVPVWAGSGTSVTLADAPITVSGNNSTFAGGITVSGNDAQFNHNIILEGGIFHKDDTNTSIGFPADDTIGLTTSGTERMRIDSSGDATFAGAAYFTKPGVAAYGSINLENDDPFIRLYDNGTGSTADKKKWDIRVIGATGSEQFDIRTVNDANNVFSTKLSIAHNGNATFAGDVYIPGDLLVGVGNAASWHKVSILTGGFIAQNGVKGVGVYADANANSEELFAYDYNASSYIPLKIRTSVLNVQNLSGGSVMYHDGANVGIGTTSPQSKLHVDGDIRRELDGTSTIGFGSGSTSAWYSGIKTVDFGSQNVGLTLFTTTNAGTTNVDALTIDEDGNVGIGTTNPDRQLELEAGTGAFLRLSSSVGNETAGNNIGKIEFYTNDTDGPRVGGFIQTLAAETFGRKNTMIFGVTSSNNATATEALRIDENANVGIGTSAPGTYKLSVAGDLKASTGITIGEAESNDPYIKLVSASAIEGTKIWYDNSVGDTYFDNIYSQGTQTNPAIRFRTNVYGVANGLINALTILSNGNVGIGTTSPDAVLETSTSATGNTVGALLTNTNGAGTADSVSLSFGLGRSADGYIRPVDAIKLLKEQQWTGTASTVDAALVFSTVADETVSEQMRITSAGNVGIGTTSPDTKLMVSGEILSENSNGGYFVSTRVPSSSSRPTLNFYGTALDVNYVTGYAGGGASTAMTILSGGNVGIGATAPGTKLEVRQVDDTFNDLDLLTLKRVWATGSGSDRAHGIKFSDVNSTLANIYADRTNSGSNYNSDLVFITNTGASGTNLSEKMRIDSAGAIKFNAYGAGFLQTDANGNVTAGTVTTSDTLDDVTDNGNTTTNSITVGGVTATGDNEFQGDTYLKNGGDDGAGARVGDIWYSVSTGGGAAPVGVYESAVITTVKNGTHGRSDMVFKTKDNDTANFGTASERMRIEAGGNVGIGYTTPSDFTSVSADNLVIGPLSGNNGITVNSATTGYGALAFADGTGASDQYRGLVQYNHTADSLALFTNATTKMTILSGGNVGLATTNPATLLHLGSSTNGTNIISLGEAGAGGPHGLDFYGDDATRTLKYSLYYRTGTENISMETSDGTKRFEITQTGAVTFNEEFTFPIADGSANQVLVTNGSGALSWTGGYTQYSPVGWQVLNNQTKTASAQNISSNSSQVLNGTTPVQRNSATEFQATQQGWYEIQYSFIVKNNYANRANVGAYMGYQHGSGGGVISGSHSTDYVRYNTYGEYAQVQNTYYFYAPDGITKFYLFSYLLSGSMDMTTQALTQSMISFRYINNAIT
jgi:hypothetical protein